MSRFLITVFHVFGLLGILFIPFPFHLFPFQQSISSFLFNDLLKFILNNLFGYSLKNPEILSDSTFMYLLILVLFVISFCIAFFIRYYTKPFEGLEPSKGFVIISKIFNYYLALMLLKYGFDKVFKTQFYLPEPNILFTPFGQLDKDILYWSTMGTSYSYNVFLGIMEITAAGFMLAKKTKVLGFLLAFGILINVVTVNFCFDISVKLYSCFLLLINLILLAPQFLRLYQIFIQNFNITLKSEPILIFKYPFFKTGLKLAAILLIFTESLFPYLKNKTFNDDLAPRPFLHGAYEVTDKTNPIKRFFIHREGYIIFQNTNDEMQDFKLEMDRNTNQFLLTDYQKNKTKNFFNWESKDSILKIQLGKNTLEAKSIDWKKLPALQTQFHLTID